MVTEKTQSIQTGSQENDEDFDFNLDCSDIEISDDEIPPTLVCLTLHCINGFLLHEFKVHAVWLSGWCNFLAKSLVILALAHTMLT